jgi:hypothetical protein
MARRPRAQVIPAPLCAVARRQASALARRARRCALTEGDLGWMLLHLLALVGAELW